MRRWIVLLCTLFLTLNAESFRVYTEYNPPFNYKNAAGKAEGSSVWLLQELFLKTGQTITDGQINVVPWSHGYHEVLEHARTVLFSAARTQEREALFAWVGPIGKLRIGVIAKKERHVNLQALRGHNLGKIGTVHDSGAEQLLLKEGFTLEDFDRFSNIDSQLRKLREDRLDAVAFSVDAMFYTLQATGCSLDAYEIVSLLRENDLYFAFHKDTDPALIEKLNQTLKAIRP